MVVLVLRCFCLLARGSCACRVFPCPDAGCSAVHAAVLLLCTSCRRSHDDRVSLKGWKAVSTDTEVQGEDRTRALAAQRACTCAKSSLTCVTLYFCQGEVTEKVSRLSFCLHTRRDGLANVLSRGCQSRPP